MIRIIVDSTCDYTVQEAEKSGITMLPLKVRFGNQEFLDKYTISNEEFYKKLRIAEELPKTALVSVGEFLEEFEKYPDDDIIVMTLSAKLSGTFGAAVTAKGITGRNNIHVIDSKTTSLGFALLLDKAIELKDNHTADEMCPLLKNYAERIRIVGVIDTLKYLVKGGRLSALEGSVGGLLGIKPILLIKHGNIESMAKARGTKAAMAKLEEILRYKFKFDRKEEIVFGHADNKEALTPLIKFMGTPKNNRIVDIGSVVGTHTGPGVICVAFYEHSIVGSKIGI